MADLSHPPMKGADNHSALGETVGPIVQEFGLDGVHVRLERLFALMT